MTLRVRSRKAGLPPLALPPVAPLLPGLFELVPGGVGGWAEVLAAAEADEGPVGLAADVGPLVGQQVDQVAGEAGHLGGDGADGGAADFRLFVPELLPDDLRFLPAQVAVEEV